MKKIFISVMVLCLGSFTLTKAQMNVGTSAVPDASAALQVTSTNAGFRLPQVSLSQTTPGIGLTTPTVASAAYGMMVYNTNASISGTVNYPAYGAGVYTWDGTGWVSSYYTSQVEYVGNGAVSSALANNTPAFLDISNAYIQSANITLSGTTGTWGIQLNAAGNYKIDVTIQGNPTANETNQADIMCYIYVNGSIVDKSSASVLPSGANSGQPYKLSRSYIRSAAAKNDNIQIQAWALGSATTYKFQVTCIQITRLR